MYQLYEYYGAHKLNDTHYLFRVYAPHAKNVTIKTNNISMPMHQNQEQDWEIVLSIKEGERYRYQITTQEDKIVEKLDPFSFSIVNQEYSIVYDYKKLRKSLSRPAIINDLNTQALNIYEIYLGGWDKRYTNYKDMAAPLADYLLDFGFNAVQFMPITEYPKHATWGYQTTGYFAPTERYGSPEDLMHLVNYLHEKGIIVLLDWTPAHFDPHPLGLINFDGQLLYEHPDRRYRTHPVWKTQIFNWADPYVASFLISSANFWMEIYGFDGLRIDTITSILQLFQLTPDMQAYDVAYNPSGINFCCNLTRILKMQQPNCLLIAEETQGFNDITNPEKFNFSYKQGLGWSWDTGTFIFDQNNPDKFYGLTRPLDYAHLNKQVLTYGHDQIAKTNGFLLRQFNGSYDLLKTFYSYMMAFPGKKCLFMGNEYGQNGYWDYLKPLTFATTGNERNCADYFKKVNKLYLKSPELYERDYAPEAIQVFENNPGNKVLIFIRHCDTGSILCVFNFSNNNYNNYGITNENNYTNIFTLLQSKNIDTKPKIENQQLYFDIPAQSATFYRVNL